MLHASDTDGCECCADRTGRASAVIMKGLLALGVDFALWAEAAIA